MSCMRLWETVIAATLHYTTQRQVGDKFAGIMTMIATLSEMVNENKSPTATGLPEAAI